LSIIQTAAMYTILMVITGKRKRYNERNANYKKALSITNNEEQNEN